MAIYPHVGKSLTVVSRLLLYVFCSCAQLQWACSWQDCYNSLSESAHYVQHTTHDVWQANRSFPWYMRQCACSMYHAIALQQRQQMQNQVVWRGDSCTWMWHSYVNMLHCSSVAGATAAKSGGVVGRSQQHSLSYMHCAVALQEG